MGVSKSICDVEHKTFIEIKQVSCMKKFLWSIVAQGGTNLLIFYVFEYHAEYGAECSAESGAK